MNGQRVFAGQELTLRLARIDQAQADGNLPTHRANTKRALWLAIACAAGADHPEFVRDCIWPRGSRGRALPGDYAPAPAFLAELARARDVAMRQAEANPTDLRRRQRCWDLAALAETLGAPPPDLARIKPQAKAA